MENCQATLSFSYVVSHPLPLSYPLTNSQEILKDTVYDLQASTSEPNVGYSRRWSQSFTAPTIRPKLDLRTDAKGNTVIANMQITEISSPDEFRDLYR